MLELAGYAAIFLEPSFAWLILPSFSANFISRRKLGLSVFGDRTALKGTISRVAALVEMPPDFPPRLQAKRTADFNATNRSFANPACEQTCFSPD